MKRVLVTNRRSRANRRRPGAARGLADQLGAELVAPEGLQALAESVPRLAAADELWIHGGDGTVHRVLTALCHAGAPVPTLSVLRAGTMNIVADSIGQRVGARAAVARAASGAPAEVAEASPMRLDLGDGSWCVGFLAGGGIISRFLELYYDVPDPTPARAGVLLARGAMSALVGGRLARRLSRPYEGELIVDGQSWSGGPWTAVALGSVEQLGLGFTPFPGIRAREDQVHVIGIASGIGALATELPRVWLGKGLRRTGNRETPASLVELRGPDEITLMVDGDFYVGRGHVRIDVLPRLRFHVWGR